VPPVVGVWRYRYYVDGDRRPATLGTKSAPLTRKQAERAARNVEPDEKQQLHLHLSKVRRFGDLLTDWVDYGRTRTGKSWAARTAFDNRQQVNTRIIPALGSFRCCSCHQRIWRRPTAGGLLAV
jgi:hypothetical protein